jgi:hypothetical protein
MANFYEDNQDLQFYVEKEIPWDEIVRIVEFDYKALDAFSSAEEAKEFYKDIFREVGRLSAEEIAPVSQKLDEEGFGIQKWRGLCTRRVQQNF